MSLVAQRVSSGWRPCGIDIRIDPKRVATVWNRRSLSQGRKTPQLPNPKPSAPQKRGWLLWGGGWLHPTLRTLSPDQGATAAPLHHLPQLHPASLRPSLPVPLMVASPFMVGFKRPPHGRRTKKDSFSSVYLFLSGDPLMLARNPICCLSLASSPPTRPCCNTSVQQHVPSIGPLLSWSW